MFVMWMSTSHLSLLLQVCWTQPSLPSRVGFGGFGPHQPSVRMNRVQHLYKLALLQNKTLLTATVRATVSSSHIYFRRLRKKTANTLFMPGTCAILFCHTVTFSDLFH